MPRRRARHRRWHDGPARRSRAADHVSTTVVDRNGQLLRAFTTPDGRWRLPVEVGEVDQRYLAMLLAFEDRRFRSHAGVDPLAFARAALQFVAQRPRSSPAARR